MCYYFPGANVLLFPRGQCVTISQGPMCYYFPMFPGANMLSCRLWWPHYLHRDLVLLPPFKCPCRINLSDVENTVYDDLQELGHNVHTHCNGNKEGLTHWGRDKKMAAIFQTTFSNAFSWMKMCEFCLRFHWSLFLWFQLTIVQRWFR